MCSHPLPHLVPILSHFSVLYKNYNFLSVQSNSLDSDNDDYDGMFYLFFYIEFDAVMWASCIFTSFSTLRSFGEMGPSYIELVFSLVHFIFGKAVLYGEIGAVAVEEVFI